MEGSGADTGVPVYMPFRSMSPSAELAALKFSSSLVKTGRSLERTPSRPSEHSQGHCQDQ